MEIFFIIIKPPDRITRNQRRGRLCRKSKVAIWYATHGKGLNAICGNAGPDQPARMRRLIWAFVVCLQNQWLLKHMSTNRDFFAINSLGEERASLGAFRMYVCSICADLVLSVSSSVGVWEGLRFVIVALPGLLTCPFYGNIGLHRYTRTSGPLLFAYGKRALLPRCDS